MAVLNFPNSPADGDTYIENNVTYTWDATNSIWTANNAQSLDNRFVNVSGDTMTGNLTVPSLNGGPLAGLRNLLVNGSFRVSQRGTSFNAISAGGQYTLDRWYAAGPGYPGSGGVSQSFIGDVANIAITGGGSGVCAVHQAVELENLYSWRGREVTLSVMGGCSVAHTGQIQMFWSPTPNTRDAGDWTQIASKDVALGTVTGNFSLTGTIPTNAQGLLIQFQVGASADLPAGAVAYWAQAQVEKGSVATPFEHRPIGLELQLCQRYFYAADAGIRLLPPHGGTVIRTLDIPRPVTMRADPIESSSTAGVTFNGTSGILSLRGSASSDASGFTVADYIADAEL